MTDRIRHLTITLDRDYRDDDVEHIVNAISMVRGVETVETRIVTSNDYWARESAILELRKEIFDHVKKLLYPKYLG